MSALADRLLPHARGRSLPAIAGGLLVPAREDRHWLEGSGSIRLHGFAIGRNKAVCGRGWEEGLGIGPGIEVRLVSSKLLGLSALTLSLCALWFVGV